MYDRDDVGPRIWFGGGVTGTNDEILASVFEFVVVMWTLHSAAILVDLPALNPVLDLRFHAKYKRPSEMKGHLCSINTLYLTRPLLLGGFTRDQARISNKFSLNLLKDLCASCSTLFHRNCF